MGLVNIIGGNKQYTAAGFMPESDVKRLRGQQQEQQQQDAPAENGEEGQVAVNFCGVMVPITIEGQVVGSLCVLGPRAPEGDGGHGGGGQGRARGDAQAEEEGRRRANGAAAAASAAWAEEEEEKEEEKQEGRRKTIIVQPPHAGAPHSIPSVFSLTSRMITFKKFSLAQREPQISPSPQHHERAPAETSGTGCESRNALNRSLRPATHEPSAGG